MAVTARTFEGAREACLAAGMDVYLAKPVRTEELAEVLHRWLPAPPPPMVENAGSVGKEWPAVRRRGRMESASSRAREEWHRVEPELLRLATSAFPVPRTVAS